MKACCFLQILVLLNAIQGSPYQYSYYLPGQNNYGAQYPANRNLDGVVQQINSIPDKGVGAVADTVIDAREGLNPDPALFANSVRGAVGANNPGATIINIDVPKQEPTEVEEIHIFPQNYMDLLRSASGMGSLNNAVLDNSDDSLTTYSINTKDGGDSVDTNVLNLPIQTYI